MKRKKITAFIASVLVISMCIPTVGFGKEVSDIQINDEMIPAQQITEEYEQEEAENFGQDLQIEQTVTASAAESSASENIEVLPQADATVAVSQNQDAGEAEQQSGFVVDEASGNWLTERCTR